ncbi:MAG: phosphonate C-P lyase system protein PhnG [Rhodoferax sp.]|nr:phosphonate C-P lyase system protein PhnG [Rhodoferax sp.]
MLHSHYNPSTSNAANNPAARQTWMALLARAPEAFLEERVGAWAQGNLQWLRPVETGLLMAQGRAGGTGLRFNLGEVTVTRCTLRPDPEHTQCHQVGVAYILGGSHRHAQLAAVADALLQEPALHSHWDQYLLRPLSEQLCAQAQQRKALAQATRVEFFTVAREAGSDLQAEDPS